VSAEHPIEITLAQARTLARLADEACEGELFGVSGRLSAQMRLTHRLGAWQDGDELHVLVHPPGEWHSLNRYGDVMARRPASRAEVMTVALRASVWWASKRRLFRTRGIDTSRSVLAQSFQDDVDVDMGLLVTPDGQLIEWRVRTDDAEPDRDTIIGWRDITDHWQTTEWVDDVQPALELHRTGFASLRETG
jgi:hypothetical protein